MLFFPSKDNCLLLVHKSNMMRIYFFGLLFFPLFFGMACRPAPKTTLCVQDATQHPCSFEYAILRRPYTPTDSTSRVHYLPHDSTMLTLHLQEPTFVAVRTHNTEQIYLLLLAPNENAHLAVRPRGYHVTGSVESARLLGIYQILQSFNDSVAWLNQRQAWVTLRDTLPLSGECPSPYEPFRAAYDSLRIRAQEGLIRFIIENPYSKANLLALSAEFAPNQRFFETNKQRAFAREILRLQTDYYQEVDFAQQLLREYDHTDE